MDTTEKAAAGYDPTNLQWTRAGESSPIFDADAWEFIADLYTWRKIYQVDACKRNAKDALCTDNEYVRLALLADRDKTAARKLYFKYDSQIDRK